MPTVKAQFLVDGTPMSVGGVEKDRIAQALSSEDSGRALKAQAEEAMATPLAAFKAKMRSTFRGRTVKTERTRVAIIGGGAGGALIAMRLDRNPAIHVTLIDTKEYYEETPAVLRCMCEEASETPNSPPPHAPTPTQHYHLSDEEFLPSECAGHHQASANHTLDYLYVYDHERGG